MAGLTFKFNLASKFQRKRLLLVVLGSKILFCIFFSFLLIVLLSVQMLKTSSASQNQQTKVSRPHGESKAYGHLGSAVSSRPPHISSFFFFLFFFQNNLFRSHKHRPSCSLFVLSLVIGYITGAFPITFFFYFTIHFFFLQNYY